MENTDSFLHVLDGDGTDVTFAETGLPGERLVWRDVLYEGPRTGAVPPDERELAARARYLTADAPPGRTPTPEGALRMLRAQYARLRRAAAEGTPLVLWFDACLFDQAMLAHVLACLSVWGMPPSVALICPDSFPGHPRFNGLGELTAAELASLWSAREPLTSAHVAYAVRADRAFALRDRALLEALAAESDAPLRFVPAAARRLLQEFPDPVTGVGRLEQLALQAVAAGAHTPPEIFRAAARLDSPPQYWGDSQLYRTLNRLAEQTPPRLVIDAPGGKIPAFATPEELAPIRVRLP